MDDKTNVTIVFFTLVASALGWLFTEDFFSGLSTGGGVFLTWAVTREIDPAHQSSAIIAAFFSLFHLLFYMESIHLLMLAWILALLRAVNGITGKRLTLVDILGVFALTVFLSFFNENSLYLIVLGLALTSLFILRIKKAAVLICGMLTFILFIVQLTFFDYGSFMGIAQLISFHLAAVASAVLFAIFLSFSQSFQAKIEAKDDQGNKVDEKRILHGRYLYSATIVGFVFFAHHTTSDVLIHLSVLWGTFISYLIFKN
ncbi:hypothetical protein [Marinilactibacillus psychrotolerans]|uniref:Uncharacterized protein n=1 Tax=Marinilactibacillus psychrotolerans TaxID=191770 RepID=A0ABW8UFF3_9LACT